MAEVVARLLSEAITPLDRLAPELPHELTALVQQMLSRDPKRRPQELHEISKALEHYTHVRVSTFGLPRGHSGSSFVPVARAVDRISDAGRRASQPGQNSALPRPPGIGRPVPQGGTMQSAPAVGFDGFNRNTQRVGSAASRTSRSASVDRGRGVRRGAGRLLAAWFRSHSRSSSDHRERGAPGRDARAQRKHPRQRSRLPSRCPTRPWPRRARSRRPRAPRRAHPGNHAALPSAPSRSERCTQPQRRATPRARTLFFQGASSARQGSDAAEDDSHGLFDGGVFRGAADRGAAARSSGRSGALRPGARADEGAKLPRSVPEARGEPAARSRHRHPVSPRGLLRTPGQAGERVGELPGGGFAGRRVEPTRSREGGSRPRGEARAPLAAAHHRRAPGKPRTGTRDHPRRRKRRRNAVGHRGPGRPR